MRLVAGVVLEDEEEEAALSVSITVFVDSLVSLSVQDNHPMITMIIEVSQQSVYKQYSCVHTICAIIQYHGPIEINKRREVKKKRKLDNRRLTDINHIAALVLNF